MTENTVRKSRIVRLLALLLAAIMLVTAQGFTSYADTVSRNETEYSADAECPEDGEASDKDEPLQLDMLQGEEAGLQPDMSQAEEIEVQPDTAAQGGETEDLEKGSIGILEGNISDSETAVTVGGAAAPANPVHHCKNKGNKKDTTTWSYIYFGSYPQSQVTDSATIAAIDSAIAAGNGSKGEKGIDVWVNGTRYRRLELSEEGILPYMYLITFKNEYEAYLYYKWQPIKWRVLDNNDNGTLFVAAERMLDCVSYYDGFYDGSDTEEEYMPEVLTWENSYIRNWLNNSFYQSAFSAEEQNAISEWHVVTENFPKYGVKGCDETTDKVYLLSVREATNKRYGYCNSDTSSASRKLYPSAYALGRGTGRNTGSMWEIEGCLGNTAWWLRCSGYKWDDAGDLFAACADQQGLVDETGDFAIEGNGIVPALRIDLSSGLWSLADACSEKEVLKIEISTPSTRLAAGKSVKLNLNFTPKNATNKTVTWKVSNSKYAAIDKNNRLTLKKAGAGKSVTLTAMAADGSGIWETHKIKIMKHAVKSIKLSADSESVEAGSSIKIKATVKTTGEKANKTLKWTSSNTKYATVSKGKVTAKKAGKNKTVTITAASTDGSNKKAKIKIKIK